MAVNPYGIPRSAIISAIRRTFTRGPIVKKVRADAASEQKGPRGGKMQLCAHCGESFQPIKLDCDHIDEVVPLDKASKDMTLDDITLRIYCKETWDGPTNFDNLQMLCKACHKIKTDAENLIRVENRKIRKKETKDAMSNLQRKTRKTRNTK